MFEGKMLNKNDHTATIISIIIVALIACCALAYVFWPKTATQAGDAICDPAQDPSMQYYLSDQTFSGHVDGGFDAPDNVFGSNKPEDGAGQMQMLEPKNPEEPTTVLSVVNGVTIVLAVVLVVYFCKHCVSVKFDNHDADDGDLDTP